MQASKPSKKKQKNEPPILAYHALSLLPQALNNHALRIGRRTKDPLLPLLDIEEVSLEFEIKPDTRPSFLLLVLALSLALIVTAVGVMEVLVEGISIRDGK